VNGGNADTASTEKSAVFAEMCSCELLDLSGCAVQDYLLHSPVASIGFRIETNDSYGLTRSNAEVET
jgi:hypothetical protein